ncbi:PLP-dependent aminotransferase family protein [Pseudofrankia inefficax]|uniref:Transcriptional regulator, GntR family with aminotransferase domain n=1 Tax=Pseudofrankia inefficax (strain DSM 45817 / CECT 9037 / DDB 130130 / EuI1c) TaxID=298654 RepID=E3JAY3_PSEI1|nr:PLP-dependent aminotransferase family protein [Pseudofrankia inefficax]ADP84604.1 transcriptional regulator, GntR family with aminotransferase domain [Pseudofrankia inefficax]
MPEIWATSGFDLHLDLTGPRVRTALEGALRDAVRTGRLAAGTRLPSSRSLARDLGIARNTVAEAYGQLVGEGWLVARQGSGTSVADRPAKPGPARGPGRRAGAETAVAPGDAPPRYNLRAGSPDLASFPRAGWLAASRRALLAAPSDALGYTDPRGRPELRAALAEYLARARGVRVTPDRIVVCSGFTQALGLLCQVLRTRGATTIATEAFGLTGIADTVASQGLRPLFLPVDPQGARVGGATGADAVLLTPAHQFPLGQPLSPARRTEVVRWAADTGGLIIEDDYDGEFRYDRQPIGALQSLAPDHVVYAGTASKTLAPGLRLAWLVAPAPLVAELAAAKAAADRQCGALDQLTLAEFLACGEYDRHVRRRRLAYRRRRDRLVETLRRDVPHLRVRGIAAGLHAVVDLPDGQTEGAAVALAARRGLAVEGLDAYNLARQPHRPALVVGYATPPDHAFTAALARLSALLAEPGESTAATAR